ncbi:YbbR-like domain-containing protein [Mesobacillus zeae]|uniref:YbbR-like domain-containing protein n=1 Tax=Mesobacillus zeae TaxID=1917180 RepID=A0A398B0G1_9BACI|nr:CdaR family protein [Mesobacillus zeae]RID82774.1 YbbR-like domain-containing protein [Mesobacillus zeae]
MDRWLDNPWFMKAVALVLAMLLFASVPDTSRDKPLEINVPSSTITETLNNVQVKSYYDTENLVVSGVPESVDVTIKGPKNIVQQTKGFRDFEVYTDLTKLGMGEHEVPFKVKGISDRLKVTISPKYADVSIQERMTKEFKVDAEFNRDMVEDGYSADAPSVTPGKVKITGAKNLIEKISYVKATVNLNEPISETVEKNAIIQAFDRNMNKLDVMVEPKIVKVTIPVKSSSKNVPIEIQQSGNPVPGVSIESMTLDKKEATIIADPDVLKDVEKVRVEVDISKITDDTEITLPVIISNGVVSVTPETAVLKIEVSKQGESKEENQEDGEKEKTVSNIPIGVEGTGDEYDVSFINPANGRLNLSVWGTRDAISSLGADDINLLVNVSGLQEGEHEVAIRVSVPDNVRWKLSNQTANISVSKREA